MYKHVDMVRVMYHTRYYDNRHTYIQKRGLLSVEIVHYVFVRALSSCSRVCSTCYNPKRSVKVIRTSIGSSQEPKGNFWQLVLMPLLAKGCPPLGRSAFTELSV